jgi:hypothetical protein
MVRTGIALVAISILAILPANASAAPKNSGDVVKATRQKHGKRQRGDSGQCER